MAPLRCGVVAETPPDWPSNGKEIRVMATWTGTKWSFAKQKEARPVAPAAPDEEDAIWLNSFEVDPGDLMGWCGRKVLVVTIDRHTLANKTRPGVYLTVEGEDVSLRRLHYYDDEQVLVWRLHQQEGRGL